MTWLLTLAAGYAVLVVFYVALLSAQGDREPESDSQAEPPADCD